MKLAYLAFTEKGLITAEKIKNKLGGEVCRCGGDISLTKWTEQHFSCCEALVFIGATGIAVRAIAPHIKAKDKDPAVVVVDELGRFAISLISGHLGGANKLALRIAETIDAQPVITTATDINRRFAVDVWSGSIGSELIETRNIKKVSSKVLRGERAKVFSSWQISGIVPKEVEVSKREDCDVCLDVRKGENDGNDMLHLVPKIGILGIGCRKGTPVEAIEKAFETFIFETGLFAEAVTCVVSIDLKKDERGIIEFCQRRGLSFETYTSEQLEEAEGEFTESEFVRKTTGVGSVCERSVAYAGGNLTDKKFVHSGVTLAFGTFKYNPAWGWEEKI